MRPLRALVWIGVLMVCCGEWASAEKSDVERQLAERYALYSRSIKYHDASVLTNLLTTDFAYRIIGSKEKSRRQFLLLALNPKERVESCQVSVNAIHRDSKKNSVVAAIAEKTTANYPAANGRRRRVSRTIQRQDTWVRMASTWKLKSSVVLRMTIGDGPYLR